MKTIRELKKPQEKESVRSIFQLGGFYEQEGIRQDLSKAFEYFYQAATMEIPVDDTLAFGYKNAASYKVGIMYLHGAGVNQDQESGLKWIKEAAENENIDALYYLGKMYEEGTHDTVQDYNKAYQYYLLAAQNNHVDAQFNLGKMYFAGLGMPKDKEKARGWLQAASNQGNIDAKYYLQEEAWLSIWPNEDWMSKQDDDSVGQAFGATSGMTKLQEVIGLYKERIKAFNQFSLTMDLGVGTNYLSIDPNIAFWLQRVAKTGLAQGHYAVGKYALSIVNKIKAEMKDPALVHDRQLIEYYVAQCVRTKAELTRALKKGIIEAKEALLSLEEHKESVEELYSEVFSKYDSYSRHDDLTFQEVDKLLEANRLYEKK